MQFENSQSFARSLDTQDPLKKFRDRFIIPVSHEKEQVYFLGNSLGLQPKTTENYLKAVLTQWATYGVEAFFEGENPWLYYHDQLLKPLSKIVGAQPSEVVVMNQLTVNLHLMLVSFYKPAGKRRKILCEAKAFPSDQYMLETHIRHAGLNPKDVIIEVAPANGEHTISSEAILQAIYDNREELALVLMGGINYYSGQLFDIKEITRAAHAAGAVAGFDLAHAAGNVPLQLHDWDVDFACWCSYKYLNAGPGAIGGVFIHEKHHQENLPRFAGWWGYERQSRFQMEKEFKPDAGAAGWQLSTPSLLLYAAHKASLDIFEEAGWENIQVKRKLMNSYLWFILDQVNNNSHTEIIQLITPRKEAERGCQVSMLIKENGRNLYDGLMQQGIMVDWREPDVIRLAPVPLYNTFEELWRFGFVLENIIGKKSA
jgi:kynureninase